jgi:hypothetical protein
MEVGSLVRYKAGGFIGIVLETGVNPLGKQRARVQWPNHRNQIWWIDQILVEVLCK